MLKTYKIFVFLLLTGVLTLYFKNFAFQNEHNQKEFVTINKISYSSKESSLNALENKILKHELTMQHRQNIILQSVYDTKKEQIENDFYPKMQYDYNLVNAKLTYDKNPDKRIKLNGQNYTIISAYKQLKKLYKNDTIDINRPVGIVANNFKVLGYDKEFLKANLMQSLQQNASKPLFITRYEINLQKRKNELQSILSLYNPIINQNDFTFLANKMKDFIPGYQIKAQYDLHCAMKANFCRKLKNDNIYQENLKQVKQLQKRLKAQKETLTNKIYAQHHV